MRASVLVCSEQILLPTTRQWLGGTRITAEVLATDTVPNSW